GITWRDNGAKTKVFQRPWRVLTAGAATKVFARQQHRSALITRLIQYEIRVQRTTGVIGIRLTFVQITQFIEQVRAEAGTLDRLQELLRNDHIGIDIRAIHRSHDTGVYGKCFHALPSQNSRTSTK